MLILPLGKGIAGKSPARKVMRPRLSEKTALTTAELGEGVLIAKSQKGTIFEKKRKKRRDLWRRGWRAS